MVAGSANGPFYGWRQVLVGFVCMMLCIGTATYSFSVIAHDFAVEFGSSHAQLMLANAAMVLTQALLAPIADMKGVRLISLQKGARESPAWIESLGDDFDQQNQAFLDSAAVLQSLDLVITADTSVAHLAGALGKPAWLALKFAPDWRWFPATDSTPWYPQMRLFRQAAPGDWKSVFEAMRRALHDVQFSERAFTN